MKWIILSICLLLAGPAVARTHIDRQAGIKFDIPFGNPRILKGPQIEAVVKRQLGKRYPEDIHYTSGIYAATDVPYVIVWTKRADGGVSRDLVDSLAGGGTSRAQAVLGFRDFAFNREALRGEGSLPEQGGLKVKILLQLVRDRYTYVAFYYRTAAQLKDFDVIRRTLKVGRLSRLNYNTLPATAAATMSWVALLLGIIAAGGLVGSGAYYMYRRLGRDPVPPAGPTDTGQSRAWYGDPFVAGGPEMRTPPVVDP